MDSIHQVQVSPDSAVAAECCVSSNVGKSQQTHVFPLAPYYWTGFSRHRVPYLSRSCGNVWNFINAQIVMCYNPAIMQSNQLTQAKDTSRSIMCKITRKSVI